MTELLDAALYYAGKGWPVFPLHGFVNGRCTCNRPTCWEIDPKTGKPKGSPAKHPRTVNGLKDATTDPEKIRAWWKLMPDSNIGLLTGVAFDVLDVDGDAGRESLGDRVPLGSLAENGITVETGSGGLHYLFQPLSAGNRARMLPGLDWRGEGGYIVAPPSVHFSGKRYARHPASRNIIPEAPVWLRDLVQKPTRPAQPAAVASEWTQPSVSPSYGQRALEGELHALWMTEEGGRNDALNRAGFSLFQLVKAGVLDRDDVWSKLTKMAEDIGLEDFEIERTLQSAWKSAEAREITESSSNAAVPATAEQKGNRKLKLKKASRLPAIRTDWLWDGRVPMGALTLVGGREGIGKSTLCYDIASDVTRGTVLGKHRDTPRNVLIVATEDDWSRTIIPRLRAAKADLDRIFQVEVELAKPGAGPLELTLPMDTDALTEMVKDNDVDLILLDPLLARLDIKLDSHKDSEVRQALEPVTKLANSTGCAVLGLIHVNKSGSKDPLTSLMGSRAFVAVARAVLFVMVDPEDEKLRLLLQAKNNLGIADIPALRFSIDNTPAGTDSNTGELLYSGKLNWRGESELTVDMAMELSEKTTEERTQQSEASEWLIEYLEAHNGVDERKSILVAAKVAGYSESTLDRSRRQIGVGTKRLGGYQGTSVWFLPGREPSPSKSDSPSLHVDMSDMNGPSVVPSVHSPHSSHIKSFIEADLTEEDSLI